MCTEQQQSSAMRSVPVVYLSQLLLKLFSVFQHENTRSNCVISLVMIMLFFILNMCFIKGKKTNKKKIKISCRLKLLSNVFHTQGLKSD